MRDFSSFTVEWWRLAWNSRTKSGPMSLDWLHLKLFLIALCRLVMDGYRKSLIDSTWTRLKCVADNIAPKSPKSNLYK